MEKLRTVISKKAPLEQGVLWLKPFDEGFKLYNLGDDGQWKPLLLDESSTIIDISTLENPLDVEIGKIYSEDGDIIIPILKNSTVLQYYLISSTGIYIREIAISTGQTNTETYIVNIAPHQINHGTNDTTFTLPPNQFHVWGEVGSLIITLGEQDSGHINEYMFEFISGATPTVLTLPTSVKFPDDYEIEANKKYQVSIVDNIGLIVGVETV